MLGALLEMLTCLAAVANTTILRTVSGMRPWLSKTSAQQLMELQSSPTWELRRLGVGHLPISFRTPCEREVAYVSLQACFDLPVT